MTIAILPIASGSPQQSLSVDLDGNTYTIGLRWNARAQAWFASLTASDNTLLVAGCALRAERPLFYRCMAFNMYPGYLVPVDTSGARLDPTLNDLGGRVALTYFDAAEIAALGLG